MSGLVLVLAQAAVAFTTECHLAQTNLMAVDNFTTHLA